MENVNIACPLGTYPYTIHSGDTLYRLARQYNTTVNTLMSLNPGINPYFLRIGQIICIPLPPIPAACPIGIFPYIVKKGDTFYGISKTFGVSMNTLKLANPRINPERIYVGDKICIPKLGNRFISEKFNINFLYPLNWSEFSEDEYGGSDGFFKVSAAYSENLDTICNSEAHHKLRPYGSNPTIVNTIIHTQEACFIFPSSDQGKEMKNQAALIVRYPGEIVIEDNNYNFFVLYADNNHIREIGNTLTFISS